MYLYLYHIFRPVYELENKLLVNMFGWLLYTFDFEVCTLIYFTTTELVKVSSKLFYSILWDQNRYGLAKNRINVV